MADYEDVDDCYDYEDDDDFEEDGVFHRAYGYQDDYVDDYHSDEEYFSDCDE